MAIPAALAPLVPVAKNVGGYLLLDQAIKNAPAIMSGVNQFMMGDPSRNPNKIIKPKRDKPLPGVMGPFAAFDRFMFGSSPLESYGQKQPMYGTLPPSARVVTQYPEGIPTGVGGGNAAQAQSLDPKAPGGGYIPPTPTFNPNQDLPASAEQSVDTAPFQHQMAIYEQGRNAAQTQAERNQVRDLGLAIHKAHNPQLYSNFQTPMASDRTFNPLMANTFPDAYPQTREAFIAEGGVQLPQTMNNVDARNEVIEGNRLEGERAAGELASSLEAQEFMKKFLASRAGGK
jgi:hypothetical protein